jgi:quercetin dioxygenase-like cupin family protein
MSGEIISLEPFKHAPSIEISTWYKGILSTQVATDEDTGGAFDFVLSNMKSGTEPPPHVHTREHEFLYVLEGSSTYLGNNAFRLDQGNAHSSLWADRMHSSSGRPRFACWF